MPAALPPGIGKLQALLDADPQYQKLIKATHGLSGANLQPSSLAVQKYAKDKADQLGVTIPDGWNLTASGQISPDKESWLNPVTGLGLVAGLGAAGLLFGGAAAAAAGGAGAGEAAGLEASSTLGGLYGSGATAALAAPAVAAPAAAGLLTATNAVPAIGSLVPATTGSLGSLYGAAAPAVAASVGSKAVGSLTGQPNIWSTIIGTVGNLIGAKNSADAANDAAKIQSDAVTHAADLQAKAAADSLAFQKQQWDTTQQNQAPWLKTGQGAITTLGQLMGLGGNAPANGAPSGPAGPAVNHPAAPVRPPVNGSANLSSIYGSAGPQEAAPQAQAPASNYARITWPDGSSDTVERGSLPQYQLLGAQVSA